MGMGGGGGSWCTDDVMCNNKKPIIGGYTKQYTRAQKTDIICVLQYTPRPGPNQQQQQ